MGVLLYQPAVWMHIQSSDGAQTIYDVSQDIVSGQVTLTENQSHQMKVVLLNKGRKYDKLFKPNDRFVIWMKRLTKLQIMAGYLDTVPFFSVWPRSITITGSSSLKRLQYRFWDPGDSASFQLLRDSGNEVMNTTQDVYNDSGMGAKLMALLTGQGSSGPSGGPGGWDPSAVHISALPSAWVNQVAPLFESIAPQLQPNPMQSLTTSPLVAGQNPLTSTATTKGLTGPGDPPVGAVLPSPYGHATVYAGSQDVQAQTSYYCQMQWLYQNADGAPLNPAYDIGQIKSYLSNQKLLVGNPETNSSVVVSIAGWGPPTNDKYGSVIGLSPDAWSLLGFDPTADPANTNVNIAWVADAAKTSPGPFNINTSNQGTGSAGAATTRTVRGITDAGTVGPVKIPVQPTQTGAADATQTSDVVQKVIQFAESKLGLPYVWGGVGPNGYDCSGLVQGAYASQGIVIPRTSEAQWQAAIQGAGLSVVTGPQSTWLPGDLIFYEPDSNGLPAHVVMYVGLEEMIEAPHTGVAIRMAPVYPGWMGVARVTNAGGVGVPATGFGSLPALSGSGTAPDLPGGATITQDATGGLEVNFPAASTSSFISSWLWMENNPDPLSLVLTGYRALMNDVPLLPMIETICQASMRSFCSAPNGDFIAWFPDYFNVYKTLGVVSISDIELQDFTVNWSDLPMITHQYTAGTYVPVSYDVNNPGGAISVINMMHTGGVATIDFPQILQELFHLPPDDTTFSRDGIYQRFGARPNFQQVGTIVGPVAEFWYALYRFQYNWATQFAATVPICFMPELYPGMIMQIPSQSFQAYVQSVTHSFNLGSGGGFTTQVTICAPSEIGNPGLWGFAKGGS